MGWPQALVPERALVLVLVLVRALVPERVLALELELERALALERALELELEPALVLEPVQVASALAPEWALVSGQGLAQEQEQALASAPESALAQGSAQGREWASALAHRLPHRHKPSSPQRRTAPPGHASAGGWRARVLGGRMLGLPGARSVVQ
ncbi:hypothetical protein [Vandammella animalimorsus]|uniref:hypothetical protein n=1 Tax=Vandammella animalimorsus TaxID=2029117 RepID=UPI0023B14994|nr:hypothetical protein [Vandammella animalimorsus]